MNSLNRSLIVAGAFGALSLGCGKNAPPVEKAGETGLTPGGMVDEVCAGGTCPASRVIGYWKDSWSEYAVQRQVTFHEESETSHRMVVTDGNGDPATLEFEVGVPVTLTIKNPASNVSGKHYFSAPDLFRNVAWRKVETADAEYKAPYFTAVELLFEAGVEKELQLYFVPMAAGSYEGYCEIDVMPDGDGNPDLTTGHAGHGMKTTIGVDGDLGVTLDQEIHPDWDEALGSDARRSGSDPVWVDGARDETFSAKTGTPIALFENGPEELAFDPDEIALTQGVGYVLGFTNAMSHESAHYFTAPEFLRTVVLRKGEDTQAEVKAPYFTAVEIVVGGSADLFLVPTQTGSFTFYCENGVSRAEDGAPDLTTGHAGVGAIGTVTVTAP